MNKEKLKNPFIKVLWEDVNENLTSEKIKRVKAYFEKKYASRNVKVYTKVLTTKKTVSLSSIETSENILDKNYQKKIIKEFIDENKINVNWNLINKLDDKVNVIFDEQNVNKLKNNRWELKRIEFSNFLSYGDNNVIDFTKFKGITLIESEPKNFGGKSTASHDLLKFLFFNSTSKTKVNADIFNSFRENDTVHVKGEIVIDGYTYIIERKLTRKLSKNNEYNVTNKLEFFKIDENGNIINLNGEQRRETENFITTAIGSEEDFLMTIMTTGQNLEDLIESKPTQRGNILTKFLGLETIKIKEDIAKEIYNDWSKKLISNTYNITNIQNEQNNLLISIDDNKNKINELNKEIKYNEKDIEGFNLLIENLLLKKKHVDDNDMLIFNESSTLLNIQNLKNNLDDLTNKFNDVNVVEPTKYYLESEHDELNKKINDLTLKFNLNNQTISNNRNNITKLKNSTVCPTCKRELENISYENEINELTTINENLSKENNEIVSEGRLLREKESEYKILKNELFTYERNKLLKAKYELEIEQKKNELNILETKLEKYYTNKNNLEENKKIDLEIQVNKSKLLSLNNLLRNNVVLVEKLKNDIGTFETKMEQNSELIKKINAEQDYLNIFKVYLQIFGKNGLSKVILRNMIPLLNQELHELLIDSCYFSLELTINEKNEIDFIMIDNETRVVKNLMAGSGYEKTISSLALRAVLTKISILPKPNIMVMDEIFGKIADENLEMVGDFFKKIRNYFDHILLIVHNPLIRNWSDNIIMIKKENNISSIDYITVN